MVVDERINTDVKYTSEVFLKGVSAFKEKNARMIAYLDRKTARAMEEINGLQSVDIAAGYMPDDDNDIIKLLDEIEEEMHKDAKILCQSISGTNKATKAVLEASGFMRLSKSEGDIKSFPD